MGSAVTERCLEALLARRGQCALMANILTRTSRMLDVARSGDWTLVAAMEKQARSAGEAVFLRAVVQKNSEIFSEALAIMLHMNEELVALLNAKTNASVKHGNDRKKHQAVAHYLDTE